MISTLVADPEPYRHHVRVSRPPLLDPPYDDEGAIHRPPSPAATRQPCDDLVRPPTTAPAPRPAATASARAALAYARLCIEVMNGFRPPSHLRRLSGTVEFGDIVEQLHRRRNGHSRYGVAGSKSVRTSVSGNRSAGGSPAGTQFGGTQSAGTQSAGRLSAGIQSAETQSAGSASTGRRPVGIAANVRRPGTISPLANAIPAQRRSTAHGSANTSTRWAPVILTRLRVSEPLDGIAEAVAVLSLAGTSCALAMRLERTADSWTCAVAQVV